MLGEEAGIDLEKARKKETFLVNILYRQNATWQGRVLWAEEGKTYSFRSALELLKLIDGALEENQADVPKESKDHVEKGGSNMSSTDNLSAT